MTNTFALDDDERLREIPSWPGTFFVEKTDPPCTDAYDEAGDILFSLRGTGHSDDLLKQIDHLRMASEQHGFERGLSEAKASFRRALGFDEAVDHRLTYVHQLVDNGR